jgi:hypothetical protein
MEDILKDLKSSEDINQDFYLFLKVNICALPYLNNIGSE